MERKIVLLDGASGTMLSDMAAKNGTVTGNLPVWSYNLEHPELVEALGKAYIEAGSEIILSNTFTANRHSVNHFSDYQVADVVSEGVRLAKAAAAGTGVKVALDAGSLSELLKPYGLLSEEDCAEIYREQLTPGVKAGADLIFLETFMDLSMMKIAAGVARSLDIPVFCSMTFGKKRRTMMGNKVGQIVETLTEMGVQAIGMNCSMGPAESLEVIEEYHQLTDLPLIFKPNAGQPMVAADGTVEMEYGPAQFVEEVRPALDYVSYVGGCCGSNAEFIRALRKEISERA